jgi:hypothetical protein
VYSAPLSLKHTKEERKVIKRKKLSSGDMAFTDEVYTAVKIHNMVLWIITSFSLVGGYSPIRL